MKKIIALLLTALMLVSVFAACGEKADGDVVKIGIYEPASGSNGAGGKQEALGIKYANSIQPTVDIGGKTYKVELVSVDNQSSNDKAPSAAAELVSAGVSVVLGSYGSGVSIAAAPTFEQAGVSAIGIACTNPQGHRGQCTLFPHLLPRPVPGHGSCKLCLQRAGLQNRIHPC